MHITGMTDAGPVFGMPGYEVNLLYIAGLLALFLAAPATCQWMRRLLGDGTNQNSTKRLVR